MKRGTNKWLFAIVVLTGVTVFAGVILSRPAVKASDNNSAADSVTITLPVSCTLKGTGSTTSPHSATLTSGQYKGDIGSTTITVLCNDSDGFDVYAMGASGGYEGNTDLISDIGPTYDIHTAVYTQGVTTDSSWSMKLTLPGKEYDPTPVAGKFGAYMAVPANWTKVAYRDASAGLMSMDTTNGGSSFTTTYEAYVNELQPAGTYTGQVKYVMIHPNDPNRNTLTTLEKAFDSAIGVNNKVTVDGRQYYRMQDMTSAICSAADIIGGGSQVQLVDTRNGNKIYWVAKLSDGNCWMTQNLDLDLDSTVAVGSVGALTSVNSNITLYGSNGYDSSNGYTCTGSNESNCDGGVITWTPERSTYSSATAPGSDNWSGNTGVDTTSGYYNPYSWDRLADGGGVSYPDTTVSQAAAGTHAMAGNYYNWSAAVASNNTKPMSTGGNSAANSICPKGWRLPVNGEYGKLYNAYKTSAHNNKAFGLMDEPLWFVRSGSVNGSGGLGYSGSYGDYWSSTVSSGTSSYYLRFSNYGVDPALIDSRYYGFSVRCIAE